MSHTPIDIYLRPTCPFCYRAEKLLKKKGLQYRVLDVTGDDALFAEMVERAKGGRTVPQIFAGDRHLGGCDELMALEAAGELDAIVHSAA
ncbi:glutaredoxin 3 [Roseospirillum parvum]|uniref:Glutaredoxin n=1 Tax=Roseospirillum parvum TaxID=83401 RepID=A0A1G7VZ72_9PROT|nr:glutaredoxin 3 [Roseospirillum parvum]SDG65047.1 glutaredoxin 3 [Roseospirillum parvum]